MLLLTYLCTKKELKRPIRALSNKIKIVVKLTIVKHNTCFDVFTPLNSKKKLNLLKYS